MDVELATILTEFANVDLGDRRLNRRLMQIAVADERSPGASLPHRAGSSAAQEGMYRFFANDKVTPEAFLAAHTAATVRHTSTET